MLENEQQAITPLQYLTQHKSGDMQIPVNIASFDTINNTIADTLKILADILSKTFGPYGAQTLIHKQSKSHFFTKDGCTVFKNIHFNNIISQTVRDIIYSASENMTLTVGDGSTTAVLLAYEFYRELIDNDIFHNYPRQDVFNLIKHFSNFIIEEIKQCTDPEMIKRDITAQDLKNIALISTNNDHEIANLIFQAYSEADPKDINLIFEKANQTESTIERVNGFIVERGVINPIMTNMADTVRYETKLTDCRVLIIHGTCSANDLESLKKVVTHALDTEKKSLLIIARKYDDVIKQYLNILMSRGIQNKPKLAAIDFPMLAKHNNEALYDLCAYTGATPIEKVELSEYTDLENSGFDETYLGGFNTFYSINSVSQIIGGHGNLDDIENRRNLIKNALANEMLEVSHIKENLEIGNLKKRLSQLNQMTYKMKVGGDSNAEIQARLFLVEDAILACKSAIEYGMTPGNCLFVPKFLYKYADDSLINNFLCNYPDSNMNQSDIEDIISIIMTSYQEVFFRLTDNVFNKPKTEEIIATNLANRNFIKPKNKSLQEHVAEYCIVNPSVIFNIRTKNFESFNNTSVSSVVNSTQTDIEILKNAFNIVTMLFNSNQFIHAI